MLEDFEAAMISSACSAMQSKLMSNDPARMVRT